MNDPSTGGPASEPADDEDAAGTGPHSGQHGALPQLDGAWLDDEELISTWGLLTEAVNAATAQLARNLDDAGLLTLVELNVLVRLHREPTDRLPVTTIARQLGISTASAAKVITHIEAAGLLTTDTLDEHLDVYLEITDRGRDVTTRTLAGHLTALRRQLLQPLGVNGLRHLAVLTRAVRDHNI